VEQLPEDAVRHPRLLPELMTLCLRRGARARAVGVLATMQARGVAVPVACMNALILADARAASAAAADADAASSSFAGSAQQQSGAPVTDVGASGAAAVAVHLQLMRDLGCAPNDTTLVNLAKAYLYTRQAALQRAAHVQAVATAATAQPKGTASAAGAAASSHTARPASAAAGVADFLQAMSGALRLPLSRRALGTAVFYAAKTGDVAEVERVLRLLQYNDGRRAADAAGDAAAAGAPPPRWLRKLAILLSGARAGQ
jgi:hypothetical protein